MKNSMEYVLAIDAGGTYFKSSIIDSEGSVVAGSLSKVPVNSQGDRESIFSAYGKILGDAWELSGKAGFKISGIGVSTPGPFDYEGCRSLMTHKFQSIYKVDLRDLFISRYGMPGSIPVKFLHDVHAFLLGEYWKGNAKGFVRAAAVTIGTGVGFGAIANGRLLHNGMGGPYISIFGKPCKEGILEDYVSGRGIIREYCRMSGLSKDCGIDAREIGRRAEGNEDTNAVKAYRQVGVLLGECLKEILIELEVEGLVLGGQISRSFAVIEEGLKESLQDVRSLKKITSARYFDEASLIGAASYVYESNK